MNNLVKEVKNKIETALGFKGYAFYLFDDKFANAKMFPLPSLNPILRIRATGESFTLNEPAFYLEGKPVWFVKRNFPHSLKFEFLKEHLVERGYSASEIDAKNFSIYVNRIFRQASVSPSLVYIFISIIVIACLVTYLITSGYFQGIITGLQETITTLQGGA